jgi:alkanesulfonate monooxygenase SsuD/methylene tetrahydromethanopterin reductase-like flavin-dependent oxidoreductase (luciferase family)
MSVAPRFKVGLRLPTSEKDSNPGPRWSDIRAMATTAEDVGFDSLWVVDHFLNELYWPSGDAPAPQNFQPMGCGFFNKQPVRLLF